MSILLPKKDAKLFSPAIASKVKNGTRKKQFAVDVRDAITINGGDIGWSGGSKMSYEMYDPDGEYVSMDMPPARWLGGKGPFETCNEIPPGYFVIVTSYFMGKPGVLRVIVRNVPALFSIRCPLDRDAPKEVYLDWLEERDLLNIVDMDVLTPSSEIYIPKVNLTGE